MNTIAERRADLVRRERAVISSRANGYRVRFGALALAIGGILFILYPAIRPFSDEVTLQGAAAFGAAGWIVAHVLAMVGFILVTLGLLGLYLSLQETPTERLAFWALVVSWIGIGLTLPFYGAEAFALHAIGQAALSAQDASLLTLANDTRTGPGLYIFLLGLLVLAAGAIMVATAIWKSGSSDRSGASGTSANGARYSKWSGIPFAVAFVLYIPQFFGTQPLRVAHGLLIAIGCLWIAAGMWRQSSKSAEQEQAL